MPEKYVKGLTPINIYWFLKQVKTMKKPQTANVLEG